MEYFCERHEMRDDADSFHRRNPVLRSSTEKFPRLEPICRYVQTRCRGSSQVKLGPSDKGMLLFLTTIHRLNIHEQIPRNLQTGQNLLRCTTRHKVADSER